ncbi:hypothetical protein CLV78_105264 [Aliiruegeria haliotis]|uniref:HEAT repeat protein n=1 Tax=Aliiruegeria haliotis TaxID=1280846 RepID=A0A2T0RPU5_9RHOB|nr:hypothetical protein [Aliiruegeria haliotis]PRY23209.1 hypothetical protein CLV78_105264 [Aliiruegeria haliotis]
MNTLQTVFLAILLCSTCAHAEVVRVLSGEHETFSRIVLMFRTPVNWTKHETKFGFVVEFDRSDFEIDLSHVFDLIPRSRIQGISYGREEGNLRILSDCSCSIEVFSAGLHEIAIDIKDTRSQRDVYSVASVVEGQGLELQSTYSSPLPFPLLGRSRELLNPAESKAATKNSGELTIENQSTLRSILLQEMQRANSEGLADIRGKGIAGSMATEIGLRGTGVAKAPEFRNHVRARTVFGNLGVIDASTIVGNHFTCEDGPFSDGAGWIPIQSSFDALAEARSLLFDGSGKVNGSGVEDLVVTLLGLQLGAEAAVVLSEFQGEFETRAVYRRLANIIDSVELTGENPLSQYLECNSPALVWATLSERSVSRLATVDGIEIKRNFLEFPDGFRRRMGPLLGRLLAQAGLADTAAFVIAEARRASGGVSGKVELLSLGDTSFLEVEGGLANSLPEIVSENSDISPMALLVQIERALREGYVAEKDIVLVEAFASEMAGTEIGRKLTQSAAVARATIGDFETALEHHQSLFLLDEVTEETSAVLNRVLDLMLVTEADSALLRFLVRDSVGQTPDELDQTVLVRVANRLVQLNLPELAESVVGKVRGREPPDVRHLRARINLLRGNPRRALAMVAGDAGPENAFIRANSLVALGKNKLASRVLRETGALDMAARQAWLGEDFEVVAELGSGLEKRFASVAQGFSGTSGKSKPELSDGGIAQTERLDSVLAEELPTVGSPMGSTQLGEGVGLRESYERIENSKELGAAVRSLLEQTRLDSLKKPELPN